MQIGNVRSKLLGLAALSVVSLSGNAQGTGDDESLEEVVVTGSFIKRSAQDSASPLSVITAGDLEQAHIADAQELLLRLPYESGGWVRASTFDGGGGQGRVPINLRNLGECATLPLVNGRRHTTGWMTPAGCAGIDTNSMVPTLMLERVELLKDGSSALYGSDAIAGVVNFITRDNFEGFEFDTRFLTDENTGHGDEISFGLVFGAQGERGGFVVAADFLNRNEIPTQDPAVYEIQGGFGYSDTGQPGWYPPNLNPDFSPDLELDKDVEEGDPARVQLKFASNSHNGMDFPESVGSLLPRKPNPTLPTYASDCAFGEKDADDKPCQPTNANWHDDWGYADLDCEVVAEWDGYGGALGLFSGGGRPNNRCPIDYGNFFSIQEEEVLQKIYMNGHYRLTDTFEVYLEGGYSEQEFFRLNSLAPQTRTPTIPVHNPALINDAARRGIEPVALVNRSRLLGGTPLIAPHIRPIKTQQDGDRDTIRAVVGFNWDLEISERAWTVTGSFTASESSQYQYNVEDSRAQETVLALHGLGGPNCNAFARISDPEWLEENRGSGNKAYAKEGAKFEDGNCYYLNPMGSSLFDEDEKFRDPVSDPHVVTLPDGTKTSIANPPELLEWLDGTWNQNDEFEQRVIDLVAAGDVMDLPNGPVGFAVGFQQRVDSLYRTYDINFRQFNAAFRFGGSNVEGTITTNAIFTELQVPLPGNLDMQVAIRQESLDEVDTSTTDPKVSFLWRPNDAWSVRASWGTSFRVGSILQLIGPQTIVSNTNDPYNDTSFFIPWISAGAEDLEPEESTAISIGFTWAPQGGALDGFSLTVDRWQIDFSNLITKESAPGLLFEDGCARSIARAAAGGAAAHEDCLTDGNPSRDFQEQPKVIRNANLNPVRILPDFINADEGVAAGVDIEANYRMETNGLGMFNFGVVAAWFQTFEITTDAGNEFEGVGTYGILTPIARPLPEHKINFNINWAMGPHNVFWQTRFISGVEWDGGWSSARAARVDRATGRDIGSYSYPENPYEMPGTMWTDVYYSYTIPSLFGVAEGGTLTLGIRNLLAEEPPVANNANGYSAILHDARGRMFMVRYRMSL